MPAQAWRAKLEEFVRTYRIPNQRRPIPATDFMQLVFDDNGNPTLPKPKPITASRMLEILKETPQL